MSDRDLLESLSEQMSELVRNVAEVRQSNKRLEAAVVGVQSDVGTLKSDVATLKTDVGMLKSDVATLKADVGTLKTDVAELKHGLQETNAMIDECAEFLSKKIDHFVEFVASEITQNRITIEEQRYINSAAHSKIEGRVDAIERRLDKLEAISPGRGE